MFRIFGCYKGIALERLPYDFPKNNNYTKRAVVVAQFVEWLLSIPEVRGSNPVIGKIYLYWKLVYCQLCIEKTKIKKKWPGMAHFKKTTAQRHFPVFYCMRNWSRIPRLIATVQAQGQNLKDRFHNYNIVMAVTKLDKERKIGKLGQF